MTHYNPAHLALMASINPESKLIEDFSIIVGSSFPLGHRIHQYFYSLLCEVKTSSIENTQISMWSIIAKNYNWTLMNNQKMTSAGLWVINFEQTRDFKETKNKPLLWC